MTQIGIHDQGDVKSCLLGSGNYCTGESAAGVSFNQANRVSLSPVADFSPCLIFRAVIDEDDLVVYGLEVFNPEDPL